MVVGLVVKRQVLEAAAGVGVEGWKARLRGTSIERIFLPVMEWLLCRAARCLEETRALKWEAEGGVLEREYLNV